MNDTGGGARPAGTGPSAKQCDLFESDDSKEAPDA